MAEVILLVAGLIAGVDWRVLILLGVSMTLPFIALALVVIHRWRSREGTSTAAAVFCHSVSRELRSGASFRTALSEGARITGHGSVADTIQAGHPLGEVGSMLAPVFPEISGELGSLIDSVQGSGATAAALFEELGDLAMAQIELKDEVRIATSPARASSTVMVGLPVAYVMYQVSSGSIATLLEDPSQRALAMIGIGLVAVGVVYSLFLIRRVM